MFLCFCGLVMAQEANETSFKMAIGDTVVWKPFENCDNNGFNINGPKIISFKAVQYGDRIQVVAKNVGKSSIVATCNDNNAEAIAKFTVFDPNEVPVVVEKPVKPATQTFTGVYKFNPPTDNFFITINDMGSNVKETFDAFGASFPILNSFEEEVVNKSNLSNYYVGMEKVLNINCWHFFVDFEDEDMVIQYWVDPANGCTLKRQMNANPAKVVTVYDLKYTKLYFGPSFKKGLHDTRR